MSAGLRTKITPLNGEKPTISKKRSRYTIWSETGLFEKGVNYTKKWKDTLMTYLEDGYCSFSNNLSEKAIHSLTIANKN
ncbi:MAG: hypothetical protein BHV87_02045 [Clostridiales bacterium 36_14]|nr:MAG: hypothetical protein BHV87_02045 [Clostridiales bacterium 36_14]